MLENFRANVFKRQNTFKNKNPKFFLACMAYFETERENLKPFYGSTSYIGHETLSLNL